MWRHPDHPAPPPPAQRGEVLAVLRRGHGEELRVVLDEYEGHAYLALRVWAPGPDGRLLPVRGKGCSVRLREATEVADALLRGLDLAEGDEGPPRRPPAARGRQAARRPSAAPARSSGSAEAPFDEFA
jgi:hypothetical protein